MGSANWGEFWGSPNHAVNWMAPCFSVLSSEAGGNTYFQAKKRYFQNGMEPINKLTCLADCLNHPPHVDSTKNSGEEFATKRRA
jgi:hypothetical protein